MNISRENTGDLTATLKVEIFEADYAENVAKSLADLRRKATIPGFRVGKVPAGMVNKMYGKSVLAEEINKMLSDGLNNYVTENKLDIIGQPLPSDSREDDVDFENNKDFAFYFDLGFFPQIDLELNKDIHVFYHHIEVTEDLISEYETDILERFGQHTAPDTIEANSTVKASFTQLDASGAILEGGIQSKNGNFSMADIQSEEVKAALIGRSKNEVVVFNPVTAFGNLNKVAAMLSVAKVMVENLEANFEVVISDITNVLPAEINEDLFKKAYPSSELKSHEDLRNRIKEDAAKQFDVESDKLFLSTAMDTLVAKANLSLPDSFLKRWIHENNKHEISMEQIEEQYLSYSETFKWQLLQSKLIKDNDIHVSVDDVKNQIRSFVTGQYFGGMEMNPASEGIVNSIIESVMKNEEETNKIYNQLLDEKVLTLLKLSLSLNEETVTLDEFVAKAGSARVN
jgi:trigger factor